MKYCILLTIYAFFENLEFVCMKYNLYICLGIIQWDLKSIKEDDLKAEIPD